MKGYVGVCLNYTLLIINYKFLCGEQENITISGTVDNIQYHGAAFGFSGCSHRRAYRRCQLHRSHSCGVDALQCDLLVVWLLADGNQRNDLAGIGQERLCRGDEALGALLVDRCGHRTGILCITTMDHWLWIMGDVARG